MYFYARETSKNTHKFPLIARLKYDENIYLSNIDTRVFKKGYFSEIKTVLFILKTLNSQNIND